MTAGVWRKTVKKSKVPKWEASPGDTGWINDEGCTFHRVVINNSCESISVDDPDYLIPVWIYKRYWVEDSSSSSSSSISSTSDSSPQSSSSQQSSSSISSSSESSSLSQSTASSDSSLSSDSSPSSDSTLSSQSSDSSPSSDSTPSSLSSLSSDSTSSSQSSDSSSSLSTPSSLSSLSSQSASSQSTPALCDVWVYTSGFDCTSHTWQSTPGSLASSNVTCGTDSSWFTLDPCTAQKFIYVPHGTTPGSMTPDIGEQYGCCSPPPSLNFQINIMRLNAVFCTTSPAQNESAVLTYNGTNQYSGSFTYGGDTYNVTITNTGTNWNMVITNTAGCGFVNCTYNQTASSYYGAWANMDSSCSGVCGCADQHIYYNNITIS